MKHEDFRIGVEFWCNGRRWRCTDIGTRVVVGVCLEPHEVVTVVRDDRTSNRTMTRTMTADDSWFAGPPYAVPEAVFDESSIAACSLAPDGEGPGAELTKAVDSLNRAQEFRAGLLATLPPPTRVKRSYVLNKTGVIGVTVARDRTRSGKVVLRYIASSTREGKRGKATFSVEKYGKGETRRLAVRARQEGLQREVDPASLTVPAKPGWKRRTGRDRN